MKNICVIFGGESTEYEVSLRSAYSVIQNLDKNLYKIIPVGITRDGRWFLFEGDYGLIPEDKWYSESLSPVSIMHGSKKSALAVYRDNNTYYEIAFDVAFPVLHGRNGEDGTIQGLFELGRVKYVGMGIIASSVGMDKTFTKIIFKNAGIPQADWVVVAKHERDSLESKIALMEEKLGYPMFIKPANAGSSIGIGKAKTRDELIACIDEAFKFDRKVLVEEFLKGHEVECAVLGNHGDVTASCVGEIVADMEFYTYESKYSSASQSKLYIPAKLDKKYSDIVRENAVKAFNALDGKGLSRVDFFVDEETGRVCINEINTMPGFTSISMYPKLFEASGIPYPELLTRLIEIAEDE